MANTVWSSSDKTGSLVLSGGNLTATTAVGQTGWVRAVDRQVSGKFYWEITATSNGGTSTTHGIASSVSNLTAGHQTATWACGVNRLGTIYVDGVSTGVNIGTIADGTLVGIAADLTARLIWFRLGAAGNWNASASNNPATGVGGIVCNTSGVGIPTHPAYFGAAGSNVATANFGDSAFVGAVPSGFTSGFTAGVSVPTNAIASQVAAEHWLTTNPDARITQVVAEHWASVTSDNLQAVVTQVLVEHWASVASVVPAAGGPMVTMIH